MRGECCHSRPSNDAILADSANMEPEFGRIPAIGPTERVDRIDIAILERLQSDGRATTVELSETVGLSASPCHRRQKLLEESGLASPLWCDALQAGARPYRQRHGAD